MKAARHFKLASTTGGRMTHLFLIRRAVALLAAVIFLRALTAVAP